MKLLNIGKVIFRSLPLLTHCYVSELQRKDQLQEEANNDSDVEGDESVEIENEEELQKELDELEYQLLQFQQESNQLDAQMAGILLFFPLEDEPEMK
jgi:seryl-tRNA synthetase